MSDYLHYSRASLTGGGSWGDATVVHPYGYDVEEEDTPWSLTLEGLIADGDDLWLSYRCRNNEAEEPGKQVACVQHFDGNTSTWGEAVELGTTLIAEWPVRTSGDTKLDGGIALHTDGTTVYAAWVRETYIDGPVTESTYSLILREWNGSAWGEAVERDFPTMATEGLSVIGPFGTPALASDERGIVYALFGGPTGDESGQAVCYTVKDESGWSTDYGIAAVDSDATYYRLHPHTSPQQLAAGCVFSCYAEGETYLGTDLVYLLGVAEPERVLPTKPRHLWLCKGLRRAILRNAR